MSNLSNKEFIRYNRHIMLDNIGEQGQTTLKHASVMIVGMGGLGCPAAQYLAASGIGQMLLVDPDVIELSNLQRQILYTHNDVGQSKVNVAQQRLTTLNPHVKIRRFQDGIENIGQREWQTVELILDCTDNAKTRRLINRLCHQHNKKLVTAAAIKEQGQLASFDFNHINSPCYQCLFADETPQTNNCANSGVLSPLLGVMGSLQAALALQLLLGKSDNLNTLIMLDAWGMQFKRLLIHQDTQCDCCAQSTHLQPTKKPSS